MKATDKIQLLERVRTLEGISDLEREALLALINEHKTYGLVWEDKPEDVERRLEAEYPVLTEVRDRAIISDSTVAQNHVLIEGDNLEALTTLAYTHAGKIDVIYIDPPYNTGNKDFVYNDSYIDKEDSYRHSKWLSFMSRRLRITKKLLSERGLIFISIDDNEQAALKLLCDEIFGAHNFVNCVSIKAKASSGASGGGEDKKLKKNIEYLLIYSNNLSEAEINFPVSETPLIEYIQDKKDKGISWSYTNVMTRSGSKKFIKTIKAGNGEDINIYEVIGYEIQSVSSLAKRLNKTEEQIYTEYINVIFTTENAQTSIRTRVAEAVDGDGLYIAEYKPVSGRNKGIMIDVGFIGSTKRLVSYLKHTCHITPKGVYKLEKIGTLWSDLSWSSVSKEGATPFPAGKKPIALLQRLIDMHPSKQCIVLDFFAGSGSTAHAVMALNAVDGGERTVILATSNENNICESIAYPRLQNVIRGYAKVAGLSNNNLRYYRTDFVSRERTQRNRRELMEKSTDLLCIKEDLYTELSKFGRIGLNPKGARFFANDKKKMLIIYRPEFIPYFVEEIDKMEITEPIKVYVYAPDRYAYDDEFAIVADKVSLCALPQNIIDAMARVMPDKVSEKTIAAAAPTIEPAAEESSLFGNLENEEA